MVATAQLIHKCEWSATGKQDKRMRPLWHKGWRQEFNCGDAWHTDYVTQPWTHSDKHYVLSVMEATTCCPETYPVPNGTTHSTVLGLEKLVFCWHGSPGRTESHNGSHFKNSLIDTWAKEHGIGWVYHIPYHAPASGNDKWSDGLLRTMLKAGGGGTFWRWDEHLAEATW